jgi:tetratricopeptide (TPR) repeat protein/archaellum biogenesis ATPase FlaH
MKCPNCEAENPDNKKFCGDCGAKLKTVCPRCGAENPPAKKFCGECGQSLTERAQPPPKSKKPSTITPSSFAGGRYQVKKLLGEGGKKKVYLAHDTLLDRDVAFALIKTEKLDEVARTRITREAQAMGRLGDHPNIGTVFDIGEHQGQPYIVQPLITGGDIEGLIEKAPEHRLPLGRTLDIAKAVCRGLIFAHARGIIHRDLKPGNVMLGEDGTAKIVDFGLAIAVDRSRLTQSGMMVGTVSYMPPEQAMGGKATTKADLYSLGAMLYEMVTGRPPFVGDDPVSIIGQHINTPPVSPTWHRADLPPALEALIMQLLEKDPEKRPESAAVVLEAMEAIGAGNIKEISQKAPAENPLYRRVFIGREEELKQLQSAFDGAISGQGALMMVMGEPGIGKTALCEQLGTYVTLRGGRTLVGHCYEEGSLSLPYLAFVEAMRSYILSRDVKDLREELGTGAADVARIVSEIRDRLKVKPRTQKDPEEERYRLMQAVTGFLTNAASVQPLLAVLEDLHDADKGTLDMLTHVSRHLSGARLLIVGTYRDVEVDRSHPLSAALADLRRISSYGRVVLRGLNADEVRRMLESITRESVPWGLAEAVHRQTEGNPLFVQEVVRYLAEEGLITQKEGKWRPARDTPLEMNIPEGLRDVIGKRLSLLSKECNQLLSVASVIGREFSLETLKAVVNITDDIFVDALKQAVQLSVLEERSQVGVVRYRFTHAFFRQTLYEEMIAPQRLKLHQQVARALENQYAKRLEEHAAELAEHFSQSTDPGDLIKAVDYGEMAAKRAMNVYACGEAVRLLEQAIKVQRVLDPDDKRKISSLLLELADALITGGEPRRALDSALPEAFSLAEASNESACTSRACRLAMQALAYVGTVTMVSWGSPEAAQWVERADRYAGEDPAARAWADQGMGQVKFVTGYYSNQPALVAEGFRRIDRGFRAARHLDDPETYWFITATWIIYSSSLVYAAERLQLAEEMIKKPRAGVSSRLTATAIFFIIHTFVEAGQRQRVGEFVEELEVIAEHSGQLDAKGIALAAEGALAAMDGRLEESLKIGQRARALFQETGLDIYGAVIEGMASGLARVLMGKGDELLTLYDTIGIEGSTWYVFILASLGHTNEATALLDRYLTAFEGTDPDEYMVSCWFGGEIYILEAAVIVGHQNAAEWLMRYCTRNKALTTGVFYSTCIARHLGGASALLKKYDEARQYYREAIKICTEMPFRPELALTRLQLAELLLEHYPAEKKEALEHLDFAIKEFREMKMQPSLERALRHKDILKA